MSFFVVVEDLSFGIERDVANPIRRSLHYFGDGVQCALSIFFSTFDHDFVMDVHDGVDACFLDFEHVVAEDVSGQTTSGVFRQHTAPQLEGLPLTVFIDNRDML